MDDLDCHPGCFVIRLVERGYQNVSIRAIANIAVVGLGTLYLYFPSKESIAAVTIRRWLRSLGSSGKDPNACCSKSGLMIVRDAAPNYLGDLCNKTRWWRKCLHQGSRDVLVANPAVQDVAVIGKSHPEWGETVAAMVALKPQQSWDEEGL